MNVVSSSKLFFTEPIWFDFSKENRKFPTTPSRIVFYIRYLFIYLFIYFLISCWVQKTFNIACVAGGILVTRGYRVCREARGEAERENVSIVLAAPPPKQLGWFSNRTGTSVDDGARKSNDCLTNGWAANWAPEVEFSPFRALSRRQMKFPFYC